MEHTHVSETIVFEPMTLPQCDHQEMLPDKDWSQLGLHSLLSL